MTTKTAATGGSDAAVTSSPGQTAAADNTLSSLPPTETLRQSTIPTETLRQFTDVSGRHLHAVGRPHPSASNIFSQYFLQRFMRWSF
jgi:hypothetical protein